MSRADLKRRFLTDAGWGAAKLSLLAGDASNRRYERLTNGPGGAHAVLMDAPTERGEDISIFLAFTGHLVAHGLSAPTIIAADIPAGFAIIEDLGDDLYARVAAANPALEAPLYEAAVDLLAEIHRDPPPVAVSGAGATVTVAPYDQSVLQREAMLALDWWRAGVRGDAPDDQLATDCIALVADACAVVAEDRRALVLRDYHAENLLWLPDRAGLRRVGLLDYQDALAGAPAYDLVSLLEDARRDTSDDLRRAMIARYVDVTDADADAFAAAYAALGAQRNLKIIGIFARLWLRDAKPAYLSMIPRVWDHLQRDLSHPSLAGLAAFVRSEIPAPSDDALAVVKAARA